jgi:hypothetical protein
MNVGGEQQQIDVQRMRDNLNASVASLAQAIPQFAAQGQDPSKLVNDIAEVIKERQKGTNIEDAVQKVFAPAPQVPPAEMTAPAEQPVPAAPVEAPPGGPSPTAPEQALQMQGQMDIQALLGQL